MDRSSSPATQAPVDRRSGHDRRIEGDRADARRAGRPTVARWPLVVTPDFEASHPRDPWATIVHRTMADYQAGRADAARLLWDERIVWRIDSTESVSGPEAVFDHHRRLQELSDGTFRQTLISLEGSGGPIVEAHVRTTARRGDRTIDLPTLIVFELAAMRIRQVTEIPGDQAAWDAFWAD